jgi:hypothetical protein
MLSATGLDLEVENIHHDTGFPVEQNDVVPYQYVGAVRRWRRQHVLDLSGQASAILGEAFRVAPAAFPIQAVSDFSLQVGGRWSSCCTYHRRTPAASTELRPPEAWSTSSMDLQPSGSIIFIL